MADIVTENQKPGSPSSEWSIEGAGDLSNQGFTRQFSVNAGEQIDFSCHATGTVIDVYRIGWYGGAGWTHVTRLANTPTAQPAPTEVPGSNGALTASAWSITASWSVPADATSGLYVGVLRNTVQNNGSYIPFIVRDDDAEADVIYKTSESTWALAYNYYGGQGNPLSGKSLYGSGGPLGAIQDRSFYASYHLPIITRAGIPQTYWLACEAPLIRFLERSGIHVKYVASKDLDRDPAILSSAGVFLSSGHDEYWSANMRSNTEAFRDAGGHALFMSGNEVFWKTRFDDSGMWCYKDTMPGPGGHVAGTPLDPVTWTGTWKDTRYPDRRPENELTGTDFRMNGIYDLTAELKTAAGYANHPVWGGSALVDSDLNFVGAIGFEADRMAPTQPEGSVVVLAQYTRNIDGSFADNDGQTYNGNGNLTWGIVAQRYESGAVVVGFGTCQWSWMLDAVHDRGTTTATQPAAQQFTTNLLADLGATAVTPVPGVTLQAANPLSVYGAIPGATAPTSGPYRFVDAAGREYTPFGFVDGVLTPLRHTDL